MAAITNATPYSAEARGHSKIDNDHEEILAQVAHLSRALRDHNQRDKALNALDAIIDLASEHFAYEEEILGIQLKRPDLMYQMQASHSSLMYRLIIIRRLVSMNKASDEELRTEIAVLTKMNSDHFNDHDVKLFQDAHDAARARSGQNRAKSKLLP